MKKLLILPFVVAIFFYAIAVGDMPEAIAANITDGTYQIEFEMLQAENDSVSIANDYFEKPAILTLENGVYALQFTVNHSKWVKELQSASEDSFVDVHIIREDEENDVREIAFKVDGDILDPLFLQMHVVIEDMQPAYDHKYSVRLALDLDSIKETDKPAVVIPSSDKEKGNERSPMIYYVIIVGCLLIVFFVLRGMLKKKN